MALHSHCKASFLPHPAAHGGPPNYLPEAWQNEMWRNLSMDPFENSHQKGSTTSAANSTLFPPPPALPQKLQISA